MAHEVIMPALGMAQESGVIVSWLKAPGDPVTSGEALMEVETDKAVMEVEAQADGFLTDVQASEGDDVPVGQVIALISETAEGVGEAAAPAANGAASRETSEDGTPTEGAMPEPSQDAGTDRQEAEGLSLGTTSGDRILASPKAKRLAREQGLDLRQLAAAGHPQPFRAADVEVLGTMPEMSPGGPQPISARAALPTEGYQAFLDILVAEGDTPARHVIAAFAAGALRRAAGRPSVAVRIVTPRQGNSTYLDPDRIRISDIEEQDIGTPDLIVLDLTQSRIARADLSGRLAPVVTVGRDQDSIVITLAALPDQMDDLTVIACLDDLAGRFEDPLRHLL